MMTETMRGEVKLDKVNVFEDMPEHGSVVAQLSKEELQELWDLSDTLGSYMMAPRDKTTMDAYKSHTQRYRQFWITVGEVHGFPYAWPLSVDQQHGYVYIDDKNK